MEKIITCPNCGQQNRIPDDSVNEAKCGKCWKIIYKNPKEIEKEAKGSSEGGGFGWIIWLGIIGFIVFLMLNEKPETSSKDTSEPAKSAFAQPEQMLPDNGEIRSFTQDEAVAPLQINTSAGSNYLVKLKDAFTNTPVLTIFITGGNTVTANVPLGTYEITYAAGDKWYGYDYLFGPDTSYSKADTTFTFSNEGYQVSGYTITLYQVSNGNMQTSSISESDF